MSTSRASDMLIAIWSFCEPEDREAFVSYLAIGGYLERASSAVEVGAPVSPEGQQNEPDDAADASGDYLREPATAASGQIIREGDAPRETGRDYSGVASCPDTEFQSGDDAFSEVKGTARPENAAGVEPSSSDNPSAVAPAEPEAIPSPPPASGTNSNPQADSSPEADKAEASTSSPSASATNPSPAYLAGDDGHRGTPSSDALAAGQGESPDSIAKSGQAVTNPKPFCLKLKDGHCKIAFETAALCAACNAAKARAAA